MDQKRTLTALKIAFAAISAIFMSEIFHLDFSISAGIVAILTVAPTKKETFSTAKNRLLAFIAALVLSFLCFETFGYGLTGFYIYLLGFMLICQWNQWASAMAMDSVLISHFLTFEVMNLSTLLNEILLFSIGTGLGVLVNLHLHANVDFMKQLQEETDEQIKTILSRLGQRIIDREMEDSNGECFRKLKLSIQKASDIAQENYMNQFQKNKSWDMDYIAMREQQIFFLYNIYKRVRTLPVTPSTAEAISQYFQFLSDGYYLDTPVSEALARFYTLHQFLDNTPMPETRNEFEARAKLYAILGDMEDFLLLKKNFLEEHPDKK